SHGEDSRLNRCPGSVDHYRKRWLFDFWTNEGRDLSGYFQLEQSGWLSTALKDRTFLACFSRDEAGLTGDHMSDIALRGFCKPRMWAQYGDNHKGVCLVFLRDRIESLIDHQFSSSHIIASGPVRYLNRGIARNLDEQQYTINVDSLETVGRDAYFRLHLQTHFRQLFFEKMTDWRGENEWRCLLFSEATEPLYLGVEGALVGVLFGDETAEEHRQQIKELNRGMGVDHRRLSWKNCSPWYDFTEGV
ncbi:DUF2971 domain-containing protein, partial [Pseudomonas aeruginosa]|nr:DUF2971 domain-containing protein [Pseudomonas aeruginosa]